jgi:hypothetical protein
MTYYVNAEQLHLILHLCSTACNNTFPVPEDLVNEVLTVALIMLKHSVLFKCNDSTVIHTQEEYSHQFSFCNA